MNHINKLILLAFLGTLYYVYDAVEKQNEIFMMRTEILISPFSDGMASGDSPTDELIRRYKCDFWIYQKEAVSSGITSMLLIAEIFNEGIDEEKNQYLKSLSKVVNKELDHCQLISKKLKKER